MDAPVNDPAAMRQRAATLRSTAEQVATLVERLDRRVETMEFQGPAAERFRAAMSDRTLRGRRAAQELEELADLVQRGAERAEQDVIRPGGMG
jgi:uncharacterized protein YukE